MQCSKCRNEAIIFQPYSGQHLCRLHFIADFEAKAKRAIRVNHWMRPGDHIAVTLTGDPAERALVCFFEKIAGSRKDIRVSGMPVEGGLETIMAAAQTHGITSIALATPLEDAAASALTAILRGDIASIFSDGSVSDGVLPLITPFAHIPAEEVATYARIHGAAGDDGSHEKENLRPYSDVKAMLADYSCRHPAAPHAVLNLCESLAECGNRQRETQLNPPERRIPNS